MRKISEYSCRSCGRQFESLGDMQKHVLIEHLQKGDNVVQRPKHAQTA